MIKITYFNRDKRPGNFSIEELFDNIKNNLPNDFLRSDFFLNPSISRLKNILSASKYSGDVNHITGDINFIALGLKTKNTILTVHDLGYFENPVHNRFRKAIYKLIWLTLPFKRVRFISTVSEFTKSKILQYFPISESKIRVIPNPIDSRYKYSPKVFNESKPTILAIGTGDHKNFTRLIDATKGLSCKLCFVGKLNEKILVQLHEAGVEYENSFHISREDVIQKYIDCDILFFASLYEGFGMPIVEANAVGRPVITSNCASMPEIAANAAIIVDPYSTAEIKNAISVIVSNRDKRDELIKNGLQNVKRFEISSIIEKYVSLYKEIATR
jgi:glycosyltransferase involved in cell wall biosynthesis